MIDNQTVDKPYRLGHTKSKRFIVWVQPFNKFGDAVVCLQVAGGSPIPHPPEKPIVYPNGRHPAAWTRARALQSAL